MAISTIDGELLERSPAPFPEACCFRTTTATTTHAASTTA